MEKTPKNVRNNFPWNSLAIVAEQTDVFYFFKQRKRVKIYLSFCNTTTSKIVLDINLCAEYFKNQIIYCDTF